MRRKTKAYNIKHKVGHFQPHSERKKTNKQTCGLDFIQNLKFEF